MFLRWLLSGSHNAVSLAVSPGVSHVVTVCCLRGPRGQGPVVLIFCTSVLSMVPGTWLMADSLPR